MAYSTLAWYQATGSNEFRNGEAAVLNARRAIEREGSESVDNLKALAAGYAECGDFGEAIATQQKVLDKAGDNSELKKQLGLYQRGLPFRETQSEVVGAYKDLAFHQSAGLARYRDIEHALVNAKEACRLSDRKDVDSLAALATALAANGDFELAISTQQEAIVLAENLSGYALDAMRLCLKRLESGEIEDLQIYIERLENEEIEETPYPWQGLSYEQRPD